MPLQIRIVSAMEKQCEDGFQHNNCGNRYLRKVAIFLCGKSTYVEMPSVLSAQSLGYIFVLTRGEDGQET